MRTRWKRALLAGLLALGTAGTGGAALLEVSTQAEPPGLDPTGIYPLWYQDTNFLRLELCNLPNGLCLLAAIDPVLGVGPETFWWTAEAAPANPAGLALLVLAMEGAFLTETPVAGEQITFGRVRVRADVDQVGTYTVTHPFGSAVVEVTAIVAGPEINISEDVGCLPGVGELCDFTAALASSIGPFLYWDTGLPVLDPAGGAGDNFYVGDAATAHRVFGSPLGTNFFRIEGPAGVVTETDLFVVSGKVFTAAGAANTAPVVVDDPAPGGLIATGSGQPVDIAVLANDTFTDVPINPTRLTVTTPAGNGAVALTPVNDTVRLTYTPAAGFTGTDTFAYNVATFTGLLAATPATVTVFVENLAVSQAAFLPKLMKWHVEGTSSDDTANTVTIHLGASAAAPVLGTAAVQAGGRWKFEGKATRSPAGIASVTVVSANGVTQTVPLGLR